MNDKLFLTSEGKKDLERELAELIGPRRTELAKRLKHAIEMGDLSENADYKSAKEDQGFLEGRILEIETILKIADVVENNGSENGEIVISSKVTVQEGNFSPEVYHIVGVKEANIKAGKISYESPMGKALIGHKKGDLVTFETPGGKTTLTVLKVE